ncbi:TPA: hypothetical protein N0F65_000324 [Lagenidium giganteum]|uniref:MABP domain-containing protein n=1 Tax=Lagenidium giganteum TaxID=4803 RepID=A0AAV2YLW0_9STRA|nr:TPA: hypothetical protein N0F65_000324 [Lagenidium giganteum]
MVDVVIVYQQTELIVSTPADPPHVLALELLQGQLLSLVGVAPDNQVFVTPSGDVLGYPQPVPAQLTIVAGTRPWLLLLTVDAVVALPSDWTQICSRSVFGAAPVVQPAFRAVASDHDVALICRACAQTCTTGARSYSPLEWLNSGRQAKRFISDLAIVAGDVNVAAPKGFQRLPVNLNHQASGDYVFLCGKRGGNSALSQLLVLTSGDQAESAGARVLPTNCNSGNDSAAVVRVGFTTTPRGLTSVSAFGITDIVAVAGDSDDDIPTGYVKIRQNLNEGATATPLYLCYKMEPLGAFACDVGATHSELGECLFAARHAANPHAFAQIQTAQLPALTILIVSTPADPPHVLALELLQGQLLSLVGVAPDNQVFVTPSGDVLGYPQPVPAQLTIVAGTRPWLLLLTVDAVVALPSDWTQICSRSVFGAAPVVQPAFRAVASDHDVALICRACAQTCTTGARSYSPLEWLNSGRQAKRFISDLAIVAGDVNVAAPKGFQRLPVNLNHQASGDYVFLCGKRGGNSALSQLLVLTSGDQAESAGARVLPTNCNSGNDSAAVVRVGFTTTPRGLTSVSAFGITDIVAVAGDSDDDIPTGYVKIRQNLNEGATATPLYLCYKMEPLGAFACDVGATHSELGECLFAARHAANPHAFAQIQTAQLPALTMFAQQREQADEIMLSAQFKRNEPTMLARLQSGVERVRAYESKAMQEEARQRIPVALLHERARANPSPMPDYQDELVKQLLAWFKKEFFSWMNQPKCSACGFEQTKLVKSDKPTTQEEIQGQAGRVEVYACPLCAAVTRFPRYNDPVKLLDTRVGRCGEWANCFTLCCRAMGFEARYVLDVTDHVWTEVYSTYYKRWLHCDSCENQLDCPLTYEVGWGKDLSYIFSFSHEEVVDVAKRYTQDWPAMASRRQDVSEKWLKTTIDSMNQMLWSGLPSTRVDILRSRAIAEQAELNSTTKKLKDGEVQGRVSGSAEWKSARSEDGKKSSNKHETSEPSSSDGTRTATIASAELSQQLVAGLLKGCDNASCVNPFCSHERSRHDALKDMDANSKVALALQLVASIHARGLSAEGLAMLLCPKSPQDVRPVLQSFKPALYLTLQDADASSKLLVDCSGHEVHVTNAANLPLRKPFLRATDPAIVTSLEYGLELTPGSPLVIPVEPNGFENGFALSALFQLARYDLKTENELTVAIKLKEQSSLRLIKTGDRVRCVLELNGDVRTAECSKNLVESNRVFHVLVIADSAGWAVIVQGETVLTSDSTIVSDTNYQVSIGAQSPSSSHGGATVSHIAVFAANDRARLEKMAQQITSNHLPWSDLDAVGTDGQRFDKKCSTRSAHTRSGYRVTEIKMWGAEYFDGIQFVYEKPGAPMQSGVLFGNDKAQQAAASPTKTFRLWEDEIITGVSGRKGAWTDCLKLTTSFGRVFMCGGNGGGDFQLAIPAGKEVRGIEFHVGDHLTDVTAFLDDTETSQGPLHTSLSTMFAETSGSQRQNAFTAALTKFVLVAARYLDNIAANPDDKKYQRIRVSNKYFQANVGCLSPALCAQFMAWCGFAKETEASEEFFVFQPAQGEGDSKEQARRRLAVLTQWRE